MTNKPILKISWIRLMYLKNPLLPNWGNCVRFIDTHVKIADSWTITYINKFIFVFGEVPYVGLIALWLIWKELHLALNTRSLWRFIAIAMILTLYYWLISLNRWLVVYWILTVKSLQRDLKCSYIFMIIPTIISVRFLNKFVQSIAIFSKILE
jgi:hypothetical protein